MKDKKARVTEILRSRGTEVWEELLPLVHEELHAIARGFMQHERGSHTLQATALVNETYLRLLGTTEMDWESRRHFFGAVAESMRRVLIDHARRVGSKKRGGDFDRVSFELDELEVEGDLTQVLALDEALVKLAEEDERAAEVARLRYYAGLEVDAVAELLNVSTRTVLRDWAYARARLSGLLGSGAE